MYEISILIPKSNLVAFNFLLFLYIKSKFRPSSCNRQGSILFLNVFPRPLKLLVGFSSPEWVFISVPWTFFLFFNSDQGWGAGKFFSGSVSISCLFSQAAPAPYFFPQGSPAPDIFLSGSCFYIGSFTGFGSWLFVQFGRKKNPTNHFCKTAKNNGVQERLRLLCFLCCRLRRLFSFFLKRLRLQRSKNRRPLLAPLSPDYFLFSLYFFCTFFPSLSLFLFTHFLISLISLPWLYSPASCLFVNLLTE